ncbi:hypothetical protein BH11PLA2_BH11PLA2_40990 [soil metagenome]
MFAFPVILVGINDALTASVKQELAHQSAQTEAEYRSADTVIEGLKGSRLVRRLMIVHVELESDIAIVRRLVETFADWPVIALVETAERPENLMQANRAGASQVVPMPLKPTDLREALSCVSMQNRITLKQSTTIAFTGSAAGCGTTTLATNVAYEIAVQCKKHTILVELAQQMGVIATNLDITPACTLADLLAEQGLDTELVQRSLVRAADNLEILAGYQGINQQNTFPVTGVMRVLNLLHPLAEVIILDVPCTYTDFQFEILSIANQVVLVGEQSISSIRTLKLVLDALPHGTNAAKVHVVINRYDPELEGLTVGNLEKTLGIKGIQTIPDDRPNVLSAVNSGKLLRQMMPKSSVITGIVQLVDNLLGVRGTQPAKSRVFDLMSQFLDAFRK